MGIASGLLDVDAGSLGCRFVNAYSPQTNALRGSNDGVGELQRGAVSSIRATHMACALSIGWVGAYRLGAPAGDDADSEQ